MTIRLLHYSDLEDVYDHPERAGRLAGLIEELRTDRTLVLGSGDDLAHGVLETITDRGKAQALALFQAIEPDADTVGNHDLDQGPEAFLECANETEVKWVSSNLRMDGEDFGRSAGIRSTAVFDVGDGRVGCFGLAHPRTTEFAPAARELTVEPPIESAQDAVATLREQGVDAVVGLSHLGESDAVAEAVDVDIILEGHHHERRVERVAGTVIARSAGNGRDLTEVTIGERCGVEVHAVADGPIDDAVADRYRQSLERASVDEVIATVEEPIERTYATRFHGESRLGNVVADAYRWATGAELALFPGGGLRMGDPLVGEVTVRELISTIPHDDLLVTCSVDGATLLRMLSNAETESPTDQPLWWHQQVSGARVVWDHAAEELVELTVGGEPVSPGESYDLATTRYVVEYEETPVTPDDVCRSVGPQYESVLEYVRETGLDPSLSGRIVRRNLPEE